VFSLFQMGTKNPKKYKTKYDPTYHVNYEFGGMNRQIRLYHLLNSAIQERHGMMFIDTEHVYDEETKQVFSLKEKKVLKTLVGDPVLEKFYLKPEKEYSLEKVTEIYHRIMAIKAS